MAADPSICAGLPAIAALDTFLSDPALHYLASQRKRSNMAPAINSLSSPARPTNASAILSTSTPLNPEPTPTDLLLATPPAILKLLTLTSPVIQSLTTLVQLLTWTHPSFYSSLLVLLAWWTACLFGRYIFLYGLNALVLVYVSFQYISSASTRHKSTTHHRHRARPATLTPASYTALVHSSQLLATQVHTLRATLIHPIAAHLSFVPLQPNTPAPAYSTAWLAVTSYPFYLALTYFVPIRVIFLVVGSLAILWNAPFFRTLRTAMMRSAFVRWTGRLVLSLLRGGKGWSKEWERTKSGVGIPGLLGRKKDGGLVEEKPVKSTAVKDGDGEGEDVQLQFTVFENQRWWVGLDWTHALLPGERASWTDPSLNPSSPPASFTLPPPSVTYTPSPTRSDPSSRIKLTTEWKWLDPEWKVQRSTTSPGFNPSPLIPQSSALTPSSSTQNLSSSSAETNQATLIPAVDADEAIFKDWVVDEEGWQYGDNHFEKMGPKGGLGKYTRRRAWIRRAGLVERAERVTGEKEKSEKEKEKGKGRSSSTGRVPTLSSSVGAVGLGVAGVVRTDLRERSASSGRNRERERSDSAGGPVSVGMGGGELRRRKSSGARAGSQSAVAAAG
ncbi:hypothetical protein P7C70_g5426, partial [Phenoliferia sp. Uapishka_3]